MMIFLKHRQENSILSESTSPQMDLQIHSNSYQNPSHLCCRNWQANSNRNAQDLELSKQLWGKNTFRRFTLPDFKVYYRDFPEFTQTRVHWVNDAIQPSHLLSPPFPPASIFLLWTSIGKGIKYNNKTRPKPHTLHINWLKLDHRFKYKIIKF